MNCASLEDDVMVDLSVNVGVMMKGKGFMDKNMNVGMKDFRPEQMKVERILHEEFPDLEIRLEFPVNNLKIDGHPCAGAVLDIAILGYKVAIRMMGEIHQWSKKSRVKDQYQIFYFLYNLISHHQLHYSIHYHQYHLLDPKLTIIPLLHCNHILEL